VFGMILIGRNSDKHGERRWHFAGSVGMQRSASASRR